MLAAESLVNWATPLLPTSALDMPRICSSVRMISAMIHLLPNLTILWPKLRFFFRRGFADAELHQKCFQKTQILFRPTFLLGISDQAGDIFSDPLQVGARQALQVGQEIL